MNGFQRCVVCVAALALIFVAVTVANRVGAFNGLHLLIVIGCAATIALNLTRKPRS